MVLIAIMITFPNQKGAGLETRPSPFVQSDHSKTKLPLWCPFCDYLLWVQEKYFLRGEEIWIVETV